MRSLENQIKDTNILSYLGSSFISLIMTFDITIPVLNEEPTLDRQVRILHLFLSERFPDPQQWRIVIADNGSSDRTPEIAQALCAELSGLAFLRVPEKGVGLALKTSWGQSTAAIVGYMDLDLATDLRHFPEAYSAIAEKNYDIVYGSRLHPKANVVGRTLKRELASRIFNRLLKVYLGVGFSDGMCGFKFLKRSAYQRLFEGGAQNNGWFFSTELLTVAEWLNLRIYELPVTWTDDAASSKVRIIPLARRYWEDMKKLKKQKTATHA
jgi:glycosyltransferase involved in cell wall biosynthesis